MEVGLLLRLRITTDYSTEDFMQLRKLNTHPPPPFFYIERFNEHYSFENQTRQSRLGTLFLFRGLFSYFYELDTRTG